MVSLDYFEAMRIPIVAGRTFENYENADAAGVVIINQATAKRYWGDEDPVGKHLITSARNIGPMAYYIPASFEAEIVGVVGNEKNAGLNVAAEPAIYFPQTQFPGRKMSLVVRTTSDALAMAGAIRNEVWAMDNNLPVSNLVSMDQIIAQTVAQPKFSLLLLGIFALLALVLASVGIYGVMAYSVTQRTHEMGLRVALGAQTGNILFMVLGQGLKFTLIGVAIGGAIALMLTRVMKSLLYGVSTTDPITFIAVSCLLIAIAALACYIPARRATKMDPLSALRYQ
jgi:putative ABC transport system permease protein